uniref:Uncharacterized protein n=1 Tax=Tanacetum cinerariifolium TaxID=118510 RepID=A0A699GJ35_TANCI|nr:hypothetical protein [Tanacetum cinerariifolium]
MNNKKCIVNLEYFREMLHICPRIPNQTFDELPFEGEFLAFLRYLGHSREIKKITDVNINKLHQPWRSFAAVINKCLSRKSTGYDSLRDDQMFTTIKLVLRHQNTQQFGAILPVKLTNKDIRNFAAYKEYYAIASGAAPPKMKASVMKTQSTKGLSVLSEVAMTEAEQIKLATKRSLQQTHISQASGPGADEGTSIIPGVPDVPTDESDKEISWKSSDEDDDDDVGDQSDAAATADDDQKDEDEQDDDDQNGNYDDQDSNNDSDDFVHPKMSTHDEEAKDEESFDPIVQTPSHVEDSYNESNDDESHGMNVRGDKGPDAEDDDEGLYSDVNINLEGRDIQMIDVHTSQVFEDTHVTLSPVNPDGQQQSSYVSSQFVTSMFNPIPDAGMDSLFKSTPRVDVPVKTTVVPLLVFAPTLCHQPFLSYNNSLFGFDHRLKTLEANLSEFMQTNQFAGAVSSILRIIDRYIDHRMNEAVKVAVQLQSDRLQDEAQAENEDFINKLDENIQKIIKEQVKEQVKVQVSKILPKIKKTVNEQLEAEVLTRSSNSSKTSYAVAADLSKLELKKILLRRWKATNTYGDTVTLKRRRDDVDIDEEPSAGSDQGSKIRREGKKPESTSAPKEKASKTTGKSTKGSIQPWISDLAKKADSRTSFNELMDTSVDFFAFLMNRQKVDTLNPKLLAGPIYELMKGSCTSLVELEFFLEEVYKATTDQLDWNNPKGQQYPHNLLNPLPLIPNSRGHHVIPFDHFINNDLEYLRGGASSQKYTTSVTKTKAAYYGHIKWTEDLITLCRDDDKLYKFKEGGFKRLRIQDIKDMLLLLVQGKLTNLIVKECFAFNVSLRMFTRSIVIQRRVEDLQLGDKSYQ